MTVYLMLASRGPGELAIFGKDFVNRRAPGRAVTVEFPSFQRHEVDLKLRPVPIPGGAGPVPGSVKGG